MWCMVGILKVILADVFGSLPFPKALPPLTFHGTGPQLLACAFFAGGLSPLMQAAQARNPGKLVHDPQQTWKQGLIEVVV